VLTYLITERIAVHRTVQVVRLAAYRDGKSSGCPSAMFYVMQMANTLIIVSSATDFIVYYVCRRRFRLVLRDWLHRNVERLLPCVAQRWPLKREQSTTSELLSGTIELPATKMSSRPVFDRSGYDRHKSENGVEMAVEVVKPHDGVDGRADQVDSTG